MSKKILNVATFGLAGALLKPFGKDKKKPATPVAEPGPRVMPIADDAQVMRARRQSIIQQRGRRGRASTMLTGDTLGG